MAPSSPQRIVGGPKLHGLFKYNRQVVFNGSTYQDTITANLNTRELVDTEKLFSELAEKTRAENHVQQVRSSANLHPYAVSIQSAGSAYREHINIPHLYHVNRTVLPLREQRMRNNVQAFLVKTGLSSETEFWSNFSGVDLENALCRTLDYYVHGWEPAVQIEEPEEDSDTSEDVQQTLDAHFCDDWKNGNFDRERGATFISFNEGREWIVWLDDRTTGFNLSTNEVLTGFPSEVFRDLERERPGALTQLDKIFAAPPIASNALHALKNIPPEEAHQLLVAHCKITSRSVANLDFDEFGRAVQSHFPGVIVARYDRQTTDLQSLEAVLDAFEGRFILVKIKHDAPVALQGSVIRCFDRPGLRPSLTGEVMKSINEEDHASRSGAPQSKGAFRQSNRTPQEYLKLQRTITIDLPFNVRHSTPPDTLRRIPHANDSRLYDPNDYSGQIRQYESPSAILQTKTFDDWDQIGIISTGKLCAAASPDEAALARVAAARQATVLERYLQAAGIMIDSSADLARPVYQAYGVWPEISIDLVKYCAESRNETLPPSKKITISLDVIVAESDLPNLGDNPAGYMLHFRNKGRSVDVFFQKSQGITVFRGKSGYLYPDSELKSTAVRENWWEDGPVSLLHFEGEDVLPPREDQKRKRPVSTSSLSSSGGDLAMRPKPSKVERVEQGSGGNTDSLPR